MKWSKYVVNPLRKSSEMCFFVTQSVTVGLCVYREKQISVIL